MIYTLNVGSYRDKNLKQGKIFYGKNKAEKSMAVQLQNTCSMDSLTFFDVEFANSKNKSICQVGIVHEKLSGEDCVKSTENILVDPEDGFNEHSVKVHGITASRVHGAPNFKEVWPNIEKYFTKCAPY